MLQLIGRGGGRIGCGDGLREYWGVGYVTGQPLGQQWEWGDRLVMSCWHNITRGGWAMANTPWTVWTGTDTSKKSPMELINEVPPIKVEGRIVACEGDNNPALGHPIEFICLDLEQPAICKYCGLRYVQDHHH
ncbi:hypothetical protein IFM89_033664 [Coptis chinensis]|uniref:Zinc finger CHCC-type domain-containing protein n=1 Tax=Coptis chinensis TaxID=261450 RepID=A0A835HIR2_9MAGN|nr:hypothetical protein IFM89_033664 [Coptis chinensis]